MTAIDDAAVKATMYLKNVDSVVQAYTVLTPAHRTQLQTNFPTLATALGVLAAQQKAILTTTQTP